MHTKALFRCARPSGVPRGPATSTGSLASQRHPDLERPAGFPSSDKTRPDSPVPTLQGPCGRTSLQKAQGPGVCKLPKPPASRALCQAKRASRAAFPSGCSRSLSGGGGKPSFPSPSAGDLRELPGVPLSFFCLFFLIFFNFILFLNFIILY